jgi:hypothetical protein
MVAMPRSEITTPKPAYCQLPIANCPLNSKTRDADPPWGAWQFPPFVRCSIGNGQLAMGNELRLHKPLFARPVLV